MRSSIMMIMPQGGRHVHLPTRPRRRVVPAAILAATLAAACAGSNETSADEAARPPAGDTVAAALDAVQMQSCTNREAGFTVDYPADWQTNDGSVMPACSLFDPQSIMVPIGSEIPEDIGVVIGREPVSFDVASSEDFGRRVLSRDTTLVDGRTAVRIEAESTGEGLHDAGLISYSYVVDLGGAVLIAQSYAAGEPDFAMKKRVLDRMMQSLRVIDAG